MCVYGSSGSAGWATSLRDGSGGAAPGAGQQRGRASSEADVQGGRPSSLPQFTTAIAWEPAGCGGEEKGAGDGRADIGSRLSRAFGSPTNVSAASAANGAPAAATKVAPTSAFAALALRTKSGSCATADWSAQKAERDAQERKVAEAMAQLKQMRASLTQTAATLDKTQALAAQKQEECRATVDKVQHQMDKFSAALDGWTANMAGTLAGMLGQSLQPQSFEDVHKGISEAQRREVFSTSDSAAAKSPGPPGPTLENLAFKLARGDFQNVIVMAGAGISVSAGIPDFRSKGKGLYDIVRKEQQENGLSRPEDMFSIDFFKGANQGLAFAKRAKHVMPNKKYKPTLTHHFLKLLFETKQKTATSASCVGTPEMSNGRSARSILKRVYTQNIDTLEKQVGIPEETLVNAHGSFANAHCIEAGCKKQMLLPKWRESIDKGEAPRCEKCNGLVKPDIVFFGENLPQRFGDLMKMDFAEGTVDLVIVLGTSLAVAPFNSLLDRVPLDVPRVLINMEPVGTADKLRGGFWFHEPQNNYRDLLLQGPCDDVVLSLVRKVDEFRLGRGSSGPAKGAVKGSLKGLRSSNASASSWEGKIRKSQAEQELKDGWEDVCASQTVEAGQRATLDGQAASSSCEEKGCDAP